MNMMTELQDVRHGARAAREDAHRRRARRRRPRASTSATRTPARSSAPCPRPRSTTSAAHSRSPRRYKPTLTRYERYRDPAIAPPSSSAAAPTRSPTSSPPSAASARRIRSTKSAAPATCSCSPATRRCTDDGQIFSCDLTPHGKTRKVYTLREPLLGVISAITPFNHPLNQVAHKVAPSIATNNRMVLKPTEKTPLSALLLADILYEAGLPPEMFSVVTGDPREIADEMLTNPDVDLVTFTGGVPIGKYIAAKAVYKRQVLELGGNDPIIVMEDADLDEAATLAAAGSYKNSGQRCTAVKRMLVHETVADALRRAAGREDAGVDLRRPDGSARRHGHGDRRSRGAVASRRKVNDAVARGAQLLVRQRAARRAVLADASSTTSTPDDARRASTRPSARCRR